MSCLELIKTALKGGIILDQEGLQSTINQNRRGSRRLRSNHRELRLGSALAEGVKSGVLVERPGGYQLNPCSYEDFVWVHFESTQAEHPDWGQEEVLKHLEGRWAQDGNESTVDGDESHDTVAEVVTESRFEEYERQLAVQRSRMEGMEIRHRRRVKNLQQTIQRLQAEISGESSESGDEPASPTPVSETEGAQVMVRLLTVIWIILAMAYLMIPMGIVADYLANQTDSSLR